MSGALFIGYFWHQLAFIGHDVGHNGITHNLSIDSLIGLIVGNTCTGVSMGTSLTSCSVLGGRLRWCAIA